MLDLETQRARATAPPTRWRNWWRFKISALSFDRTVIYQRGSIHPGPNSFPSREIAEQKALDKLQCSTVTRRATGRKEQFAQHVEYLGAYPEATAPPPKAIEEGENTNGR